MNRIRQKTDYELLAACRSGDVDAFGRFYERHRKHLLCYLTRRTDDPEVAADLMAESFARALIVSLDKAQPLPDAPVVWLFVISKNLLIDGRRRGIVAAAARRRLGMSRIELEDRDIQRIAEIAGAADFAQGIQRMLSDAEWEAFRARVLDEESYPQLAERLGCSEAVARKRVSRAKSRLRSAIGGSDVGLS